MLTRAAILRFWSIAVLAAPVCYLPNPVNAGELRCASHGPMAQSDYRRLNLAIAGSFPRNVAVDAEPAVCLNSDFAQASVSTRSKTVADGSREWWETTCSRKRSKWSCDPGEERFSIETQAPIAGEERLLRIAFRGGITVERAKSLSAEVATLHMAGGQSPPDCQTHHNNTPYNWAALSNALKKLPEFSVDISRDAHGVTSVEVNNDGVIFSVKDDAIDHAGSDKVCWLERITVS